MAAEEEYFRAAAGGNLAAIRTFLDGGGDPNCACTEAYRALEHSRAGLSGAVMTDVGDTLLSLAVYVHQPALAALLLHRGADWDMPLGDESTARELARDIGDGIYEEVLAELAALEAAAAAAATAAATAAAAAVAAAGSQGGVPATAPPQPPKAAPAAMTEEEEAARRKVAAAAALRSYKPAKAGTPALAPAAVAVPKAQRRASLGTLSAMGAGGVGAAALAALELRPHAEEVEMQGYLLKKTTGVRHVWQSRFFVLRGGALMYYDSDEQAEEGKPPKAVIDLAGGRLEGVELLPYWRDKSLTTVTLVVAGAELSVRAPDDDELAMDWKVHFDRLRVREQVLMAAAGEEGAGETPLALARRLAEEEEEEEEEELGGAKIQLCKVSADDASQQWDLTNSMVVLRANPAWTLHNWSGKLENGNRCDLCEWRVVGTTTNYRTDARALVCWALAEDGRLFLVMF